MTKNDVKNLTKNLSDNNITMAPIDEETVQKIKKISKATGANSKAIIGTAVSILEKSLGREVIMRSVDSKWELNINHFKKYKKISNLTPNNG